MKLGTQGSLFSKGTRVRYGLSCTGFRRRRAKRIPIRASIKREWQQLCGCSLNSPVVHCLPFRFMGRSSVPTAAFPMPVGAPSTTHTLTVTKSTNGEHRKFLKWSEVAVYICAFFSSRNATNECVNGRIARLSNNESTLNQLAMYAKRNVFLAVSVKMKHEPYGRCLVQLHCVLLSAS